MAEEKEEVTATGAIVPQMKWAVPSMRTSYANVCNVTATFPIH